MLQLMRAHGIFLVQQQAIDHGTRSKRLLNDPPQFIRNTLQYLSRIGDVSRRRCTDGIHDGVAGCHEVGRSARNRHPGRPSCAGLLRGFDEIELARETRVNAPDALAQRRVGRHDCAQETGDAIGK